MRARLARGQTIVPCQEGGALFLLLKVEHPASMEGRNVELFIDEDEVTDMLLMVKRQAIRQRERHMGVTT